MINVTKVNCHAETSLADNAIVMKVSIERAQEWSVSMKS